MEIFVEFSILSIDMKKYFLPIVILVVVAFSLQYHSFQSMPQYKNAPAPSIQRADKHTLIRDIIRQEGFSIGSVRTKYIDGDFDRVEIIIEDNYTEDDSVIANEYYITVSKKEAKWTVDEYKVRWKCRGSFIDMWTINACS